jgi:hypothetical protein
MIVNNELGTVQPLREVSNLISETRKERIKKGNKNPLYLHTDAAQAGNYFDLHVSRLGVDLMSINGGKIYGPKQTGALYVRAGIELKPLIVGGGQERKLRSGTENTAGFIGFAKALDISQKNKNKDANNNKELREFFIKELKISLPEAQINGSAKHQAPHILHITFAAIDNERLMMELDEKGVQCAVGSACSASSVKPSHVLSAIGMSDVEARASLRFSFGRLTVQKKGEQVFVATGGSYPTFVSTEDGAIKAGDYISISSVNGVGSKADNQPTVLGKALEDYSGKSNVITTTTEGHNIGRIHVSIIPGKNPLVKDNVAIPAPLKRFGQAIAGKNISAIRIYVALSIFVVTSIIALTVLAVGVRSSITSIGRNPLSKKYILRGLFQVLTVAFLVFLIGMFGVYLLLRL